MRFDRKTKVVAVVVLLAALQVGGAGFAYWTKGQLAEQVVAARSRVDFAMLQLEHALTRPAQPAGEVAPRPALERPQLLRGPDVAGTLRMVNSLAESASLEFGSVKATTSTQPGKQTYLVTGLGAPERLCQFLANLETGERLVVVESGRITPSSAVEIAFELVLATYHEGDR